MLMLSNARLLERIVLAIRMTRALNNYQLQQLYVYQPLW